MVLGRETSMAWQRRQQDQRQCKLELQPMHACPDLVAACLVGVSGIRENLPQTTTRRSGCKAMGLQYSREQLTLERQVEHPVGHRQIERHAAIETAHQ